MLLPLRHENMEGRRWPVITIGLIAFNVLIFLGLLMDNWLPINKNLWTSSYVLVTGGRAALYLAILVYLIDVRGWRSLTKPFVILGTNAIALFALSIVLAIGTALRFYSVSWLGERVTADLRLAVYRQVLRQDASFFETLKPGEVLSRLTADTTLVQTANHTVVEMQVTPGQLIAGEEADIPLGGQLLELVDGAHGPGLVPLQLAATDIDIYGGNLHKWFMGESIYQWS